MQQREGHIAQTGDALVTHYLDNPFSRSSVIGEACVRLSWDSSHPMYPERETLLRYVAAAQALVIDTQQHMNRQSSRKRSRFAASEYAMRIHVAGRVRQQALHALTSQDD
ncbi:hypothetical protein [Modicisalibacter xianhensis]|uniref:Uncharacterized protein n=1 Tax=Modicisalibacter xianhensis TaxID=442341 RepID=A0A1I3EMK1_9GAMM|nr:hypothetical protein [Halomonas xianhensis]SFI00108.1 hypothetical protein SAMN04487959_11452 [Halomonas xianhensis]